MQLRSGFPAKKTPIYSGRTKVQLETNMKQKIILLLLAVSFTLFSLVSGAGALKPDCTAKKAGKSAAMKATVGVGGRCSPADAAGDSAKGVAGIEDNGKHKGKNKDKDKKNPLKKENDDEKGLLKKVVN